MIVLALSAVIASGGSAQAAADVVEIRCDVRTTIQPLTAVDTTTSRQRSWSARDALKMIKPEEIEKWGFDGTRVDWVFYLRINRDTGDGDFLRGTTRRPNGGWLRSICWPKSFASTCQTPVGTPRLWKSTAAPAMSIGATK